MNFNYQVALASLVLILMIFASSSAYALNASAVNHTRSQTYHDRTPRVHIRGSHPHRH
jgi:hypothetical protein